MMLGLCVSLWCDWIFSCWKKFLLQLLPAGKNLEAGALKVATGTKGIWLLCPPAPPGSPGYPPHPSSSPPLLLIIIVLLLFLPVLIFLPLFQVWFGKPPGHPSSPAGPLGQALGYLHTRLATFSPGSKIMTCLKLFTSYKIVTGNTRLWFSSICHSEKIRTNMNKKWKRNE